MEIRLRPELEALIRHHIQRGAYESVDEFVERAVSLLHEQESWLADQKDEIRSQIVEGYDAAQRGELIGEDEAKIHLHELKRKRLSEVGK